MRRALQNSEVLERDPAANSARKGSYANKGTVGWKLPNSLFGTLLLPADLGTKASAAPRVPDEIDSRTAPPCLLPIVSEPRTNLAISQKFDLLFTYQLPISVRLVVVRRANGCACAWILSRL